MFRREKNECQSFSIFRMDKINTGRMPTGLWKVFRPILNAWKTEHVNFSFHSTPIARIIKRKWLKSRMDAFMNAIFQQKGN